MSESSDNRSTSWFLLSRGGLLALVCSLLLATAGYGWWTWFSPWGYQVPEQLSDIAPGQHAVFAHGTLQYDAWRNWIIGAAVSTQPAWLPGFAREGLNVVPAPNAEVEGVLFYVSAEQLARLDRYERLGLRYRRDYLRLRDGTQAWVYVRCKQGGQACAVP